MRPVMDQKELASIEAAFQKDMPDYTKISNGQELLEVLGDDSMKWAAAICQITKKRFDIDLKLMYIQGWIANVIEHSNEVRQAKEAANEGRPPIVVGGNTLRPVETPSS